jgi:hypothetical protein
VALIVAIIVNDTPATLAEAISEIERRRDNHREWCELNSEFIGDLRRMKGGKSAHDWKMHDDMARAYDNALRLVRCGVARE